MFSDDELDIIEIGLRGLRDSLLRDAETAMLEDQIHLNPVVLIINDLLDREFGGSEEPSFGPEDLNG